MIVHSDIDSARETVRKLQRDARRVGLVPTMGALHAGHMSLVRAARERCDAVALTIFVNPTQFGPTEDLSKYPRPIENDLALCRAGGIDLVFTPTVETMYPTGAATTIEVRGLSDVLCGAFRPGHFAGVATIVAKLFNILPADAAFFGEKDFQQFVIIRQMVRDLNVPIQIVGCPTVREADGLAMSSRNVYLSAAERVQACSISAALFSAKDSIQAGECDSQKIIRQIRESIMRAGPVEIDYVEVVDPEDLRSLFWIDGPVRICAAARIGTTRLIDNVEAGALLK